MLLGILLISSVCVLAQTASVKSALAASTRPPLPEVFNVDLKVHHYEDGSVSIPYRNKCYFTSQAVRAAIPSVFQHVENPSYSANCEIFDDELMCSPPPGDTYDNVRISRLSCSAATDTPIGRRCYGCIIVFSSADEMRASWSIIVVGALLVSVARRVEVG